MNSIQKYEGETADSERILYTSSSFARKNLFFLQEAGSLYAKSAHTSHRTYLDSYLFLYVSSGSGTINCQGKQYTLKAGDCAFLNCAFPYSHSTDIDPWSLKWVHFNGTALPDIYLKFLERSGSVLFHSGSTSDYLKIFQAIVTIADSDSYVRDMELHEALSSLLTRIMRDCWNSEIRHSPPLSPTGIERVHEYLSQHFEEKISLEELSRQFFISRFYLTRLFKAKYGITINNYLSDLRIRKAKELLRFSSLSLERIGRTCGFYDLPYFSRQFKKAEGISPSAYRNQWK